MNDLSPATLAQAQLAPASAILAAAALLLPSLERGQRVDSATMRAAMEIAFGASDASGIWDWKAAYDACEVATVLFLQKYGRAILRQADMPAARLAALSKISGLLPSHTRRSEESQALQQFSTPIPLGFAALTAAAIGPDDMVLEPSAGTGLLAILAEISGGSLIVNELADTRADLLASLFPALSVGRFDAAQIHDHLDAGAVPSVVLMNPPFSAMANVTGKVQDAAFRHIASALARLAPGGRLVTITGAGFGPDMPSWRDAFVRLQESGRVVFSAAIDGSVYARHGTTFPTRLTVIDKIPAEDPTRFPASPGMTPDVGTLLGWIANRVPPRPSIELPKPPPPTLPVAARSVRGYLARANAAPTPGRPTTSPAAVELAYGTTEAVPPNAARLSDAIYEEYGLQSIRIPDAVPHPTKLVQSAAMASVAPPRPTYRPLLPADICQLLSDAQLETVIYAGEAHSDHLAGSWTVDETFDTVNAAADGVAGSVRFRRGFMLGDGTGAGKGRQSAGIILDNWLRGRRKAVWISKSDKLIEDAQRDWSALGQERLLVTPLSRFFQGKPISLSEGILFTTYATLRSDDRGEKVSRVRQIVDWLGRDFDGVIIFDESHAMQNAGGGKGERGNVEASQQGRAGLRLQHALPDARVVYVSATGATTVHNLAYAQRLGLWGGEDFPFATRAEFVEAIEAGGVAAMEVLARDLRALGLYTARSLSYDGVEYELVEHQLTDEQRRIYDAYAGAFAVLCAAAHKTANREDAIMRRNATPSLLFGAFRVTSFTLFFLRLGSEGIEPGEQACVTFPACGLISRCWNAHLLQRLSLGFEIGLGVVVGRVEADMPQPAADYGDVDARRDEVDGRRMPEAVRRHMLRTKCGRRFRRRRDVGRQLESHARRPQWCAVSIDEDAFIRRARLPLQQLFQQRYGFRPERADAFLSTLSVKTHAIRCFEPDCPGAEIECLLDARATIIEKRQQHVVSQSFDRRTVGLREDGLDLSWLKIAGCGGRFAFERDREDLGALGDIFGVFVRYEAEEAADRGKPAVARADRALAPMFRMAEERAHLAGGDIRQADPCDTATFSLCDEPEQQPPGVPIGFDGMNRGAALLGQPLLEERQQQCGERVACFHDSASPLRQGAPTTRNRSLASCSRSCVTVM